MPASAAAQPARARPWRWWAERTEFRPTRCAGSGRSKWTSGGDLAGRRLRTILIRPATPAAPSVWPMLALTEPRAVVRGEEPAAAPYTDVSASISMGSPSGRPVPWASMRPISDGGHAGIGQRRGDDRLLGQAVRRGEAVAAPVLVHGRAMDDCQHAIAVGLGVGQPLQDDRTAALGANEPVGAGIERPAPPGRATSCASATPPS